MGSFRLNRSVVPVPAAFAEVAPAALTGQFDIGYGPLGSPAGTRVFIRANYPGPTAIPDAGVSAEWMLYTRSVMEAHIRYTGEAGAALIIQLGSVEAATVPVVVDWRAFYIPPLLYPFTISGLELPGLVAKFCIAVEAPNINQAVSGSIIVRGL